MSFTYPLTKLNSKDREYIKRECTVRPKITQYNKNPKSIYLFKSNQSKNEVILPLRVSHHFYDHHPNKGITYDETEYQFLGELWENDKRDQKSVVDTLESILRKSYSCLLGAYTGYGKTLCSCALTTRFKYKVLVLCHYSSLHTQWKKTFEEFTTAKVQIVKGKILDETADVYVMGLIKCGNFDKIQLSKIGIVIIDEAHTCPAPVLSRSLLNVFPKYLIGLTATPDREDGLHKMLYKYFGPKKDFVIRKEIKSLNIIKFMSPFVPEIDHNFRGELNWNTIQNSLAYNEDRQRMIVEIIQSYPQRKVMVLTKRQHEGYSLVEMLKEENEDVDYLIGSKKKWREDCRILIGGIKKIGVGFNDPSRTLLILASDVKDIRQNEGRLRGYDGIIIDIVDRFPTLEKHWEFRKKWYLERGGQIEINRSWCSSHKEPKIPTSNFLE